MDESQALKLGAYLRSKREKAGLSVRGLAGQVGIDQAQILRLEAGKVASPRADVLGQIAAILGIEIADVYALAGYPIPELPHLMPYLRTKYSGLSAEALAEIKAVVTREMDLHPTQGPIDGEDEEHPQHKSSARH